MNDSLLLVLIMLTIAVTGYVVSRLMRLHLRDLSLGIGGAIIGLLIGALFSVPLGKLPSPYGGVLPIVVSLISTIMMIGVFVGQRSKANALSAWLRNFAHLQRPPATTAVQPEEATSALPPIVVDTSVIIDGRIADIAKAGFIPGRLLVPRFVLAELQNIADSDDAMRRGRGRRGLEMLNSVQSTDGIEFEVIEEDLPEIKEVDAKLVALALRLGANILTTDYNLNRVAQIQGVRTLNINELANAIRPVVLPGEEMTVKVVQAGKERNQGVGYLPDGTMIVVENGDKLIGQEVPAEVTRVFQTVAGKMIFATPRKNATAAHKSRRNGRVKPKSDPTAESMSPSAIEERLVKGNQE